MWRRLRVLHGHSDVVCARSCRRSVNDADSDLVESRRPAGESPPVRGSSTSRLECESDVALYGLSAGVRKSTAYTVDRAGACYGRIALVAFLMPTQYRAPSATEIDCADGAVSFAHCAVRWKTRCDGQ